MATPFRLARVLHLHEQIRRLRTHETEQLAAQLAAVRVEAARVAGERERLAMAEAQQAVAGTLTHDALYLGRSYDGALADAERAYAVDMVRLGHALDVKRAELLRDRQEEEKYVRLAAAHRQQGLEDEARESERSLDEIAVDRYRRNQKERRHDQL